MANIGYSSKELAVILKVSEGSTTKAVKSLIHPARLMARNMTKFLDMWVPYLDGETLDIDQWPEAQSILNMDSWNEYEQAIRPSMAKLRQLFAGKQSMAWRTWRPHIKAAQDMERRYQAELTFQSEVEAIESYGPSRRAR